MRCPRCLTTMAYLMDQGTVLQCACGLHRRLGEDEQIYYRLERSKEVQAARRAQELLVEQDTIDTQPVLEPVHKPCAWVECTQPSTSTSKYCSLACRQKNARARYEVRTQRRPVKVYP